MKAAKVEKEVKEAEKKKETVGANKNNYNQYNVNQQLNLFAQPLVP